MSFLHSLSIDNFDYLLPEEKIARYPLENRDEAKLLLYKENQISQYVFNQLPELLPKESLLIFNNAKVIPARLFFKKPTGAIIEIFCLEPTSEPFTLQQEASAYWKCFIGNNKRWKEEFLSETIFIQNKSIIIEARREKQVEDIWVVEFSWNDREVTFFEILEHFGQIPLPPYLKRETEEKDKSSYQTIYAKEQGSVAAPTAGLHFTEKVFAGLKEKNISTDFVTLHVGAGTFKPVTTNKIENHYMHTERVSVGKSTIQHIADNIDTSIISIGTTSVRVLESLYWYGVKLLVDGNDVSEMLIGQWDPYSDKYNINISPQKALKAVIEKLEKEKEKIIYGQTRLMIVPGYDFRIVKGLLTNFHQPKSTLLLLIAAMVGEKWKDTYNYALENNFRFLSYGDCCLFLK